MRGMDELLDFASQQGISPRRQLAWGTAGDQHWIRMQLPDRRLTAYGKSYDLAAHDLLHTCRPLPDDQPSR